jgi:hypothetical protein
MSRPFPNADRFASADEPDPHRDEVGAAPRLRTPHTRYEVGCSCCGSQGYYQSKTEAWNELGRLQKTGHLDVWVFRMARRR